MKNTLYLKEDLQVDLKLEKIWKEFYIDMNEPISSLYQEQMLKNVVTFLSLNPSLQPKDKEKAKRGFYPDDPYPLIDSSKSKADYSFFQKFYDLGESLDVEWTTMDLLYERESLQSEIEKKYNPKTIKNNSKKFLQDQIKLTFDILKTLSPKVVVVSNAWTDKLIHLNLNDLGFSQELPCKENGYIYKINEIPFITNESKFLGSRQHYIKSKNDGKRDKLVNEINRVIASTFLQNL